MIKRSFILAIVLSLATLIQALPILAAPATRQVTLAGHRFTVEIAATDAARERGLMYRTHMAAHHGMLFIYPDAQARYFWMKNTLIPLDIFFFDAQKHLINIAGDALPCKADPCATYPSAEPARYVLELNAGVAVKLGIKSGDVLRIQR